MTREQIMQALRHIRDPKLKHPLAEHQLIRDVVVRDGRVAMTVVLAEDESDMRQTVEREIRNALAPAGIGDIHIRFREMSDGERAQLGQKGPAEQRAASARPARPAGAAAAPVPEILRPESGVHYIAIASGKGGVGKSTVTVNLAVALARLGKKVGIVDADIYGFSIPDMMGIEERPEVIDNLVYPVVRFGVKVMSMGFFVQDNAPVIWRGPMLGKMLRNFFQEVHWGELDYILLDLPPGTGDVALDVHQLIPHSKEILVTTPHVTAAFVAARAGGMARHTNHDIIGVIENMAYFECEQCGHQQYVFGRGGGARLAEELQTKLLAQIPLGDPERHPSEADFAPSVYRPESKIGQLYHETAKQVIADIEGR